MSSESKVRILAVENLRFPGEGLSAQGKSGAKARPQGVVDAQQVKIPALRYTNKLYMTQKRKVTEEEEKLGSQEVVKNIVTKYQESRWQEKCRVFV